MQKNQELKRIAPLADRMRPRTLEEFVGQEHIVGPGKLLRRAIQADRLNSLIFYGPPGTGKTTLARIIANTTQAHFEQLNAVTAGVKDIRRVIEEAERRLGTYKQRTILFIDEIHRFNKSQQDALLPSVEKGIVVFVGATTENPFFEVNPPLVSRSRVFRLKPLRGDDIKQILLQALADKERGLGQYNAVIAPEALEHLVRVADGDARNALNALELAVLTTEPDESGRRLIGLETAVESIQQKALLYDKDGDVHYDTISAFIKSMRGSDPDAALYYLARMLEAGEDPRFIARRIIICAAEDVGNADPMALVVANSAAQAVDFVGMPEARIILAQVVTYIACAPKSNRAYLGIESALQDVHNESFSGVPLHLRDSSYKNAKKLGHGLGYKYPHDYPNAFVRQQYLPDSLVKKRYYHPSNRGKEADFLQRLRRLWSNKGQDKNEQ